MMGMTISEWFDWLCHCVGLLPGAQATAFWIQNRCRVPGRPEGDETYGLPKDISVLEFQYPEYAQAMARPHSGRRVV